MCTSEAKVTIGVTMSQPAMSRINGRPVLQPTCNRVPSLERRNSVKKISPPQSLTLPPTPPPLTTTTTQNTSFITSPRIMATSPNSRPPAIKRGNELNLSSEKVLTPGNAARNAKLLDRKMSKSFHLSGDVECVNVNHGIVTPSSCSAEASMSYSSSLITESPGSIAAVRREQIALQHAQRKMRIAHYGRSKSARFERVVSLIDSNSTTIVDDGSVVVDHGNKIVTVEEKRCAFITPNTDPIYVAYHDKEWGVPVHDDKLLFELLVLSGAQVGSDWTSILKKRQEFRVAFSWFDAETVSTFSDKHMLSISSQYAIDISRVRGVIDNSNRILEIKKEFGSLAKYIWGFVNHKPISTQYRSGQRIPVKTSKSETISKDLVRRGFRFVGPTVVHSFMQAAGLTNDHLTTCHRHLRCTLLAAASSAGARPPLGDTSS